MICATTIYLADKTVAENIAFGVDKNKIDQNAIEDAAKIANLHEFVINNLSQKYETIIGERGLGFQEVKAKLV